MQPASHAAARIVTQKRMEPTHGVICTTVPHSAPGVPVVVLAETCGRLPRSHLMHMFQKYVKALRIFFFELIMYYEPKLGSKKKRPCQDFPLTLPKPARQCIPYIHRA